MHQSCASPLSIFRSRSPRQFVHATLVALTIALFLGTVAAQGTPSIAVDSFTYTAGDSVTLTGRGLEPNAVYTVTLTPPASSGASPRVSEARASSLGNLSRNEVLDVAGVWTVELVGPRMNAQLRITVEPDPAAEGQPTPMTEAEPAGADQSTTEAPVAPEPDDETEARETPATNGGLPQPLAPPPAQTAPSGAVPRAMISE